MIEPQERKTENFQTQLSMNKHYASGQAPWCQENESKGFCQKKLGALSKINRWIIIFPFKFHQNALYAFFPGPTEPT